MSSIDRVLESIKPALEDVQKKGILTRIGVDRDAGIIRIYGESSGYIQRATSGLSEMLELAYTTAEHHPYWLLLYHAAEACQTVLDKWESELSADQLSEMSWRCDEMKMVLDKLARK
jgi:hypothetical protein